MPRYDRDWLTTAFKHQPQPSLLFFFGHRAEPGRITAACLSQWWPSPFVVDGATFLTAEHWMMASKARLFGDREMAQRILAATAPAQAKSLGRQVAGFSESKWAVEKRLIVAEGSYHKFSQNAALKAFLLSTGGRVLVEASPNDRIWGIGLNRDDPRAVHPQTWLGENLLGFALMEARDQLRK